MFSFFEPILLLLHQLFVGFFQLLFTPLQSDLCVLQLELQFCVGCSDHRTVSLIYLHTTHGQVRLHGLASVLDRLSLKCYRLRLRLGLNHDVEFWCRDVIQNKLVRETQLSRQAKKVRHDARYNLILICYVVLLLCYLLDYRVFGLRSQQVKLANRINLYPAKILVHILRLLQVHVDSVKLCLEPLEVFLVCLCCPQ